MTCPLPYGFKAKANRIAVGLRLQLGLAAQVPIDVHALAAHLGITIVPLSAFKQWCSEQVTQLKGDAGGFSAALISFGNGNRMVIVNDDHSPARQNSDIAHEIGHALLVHPLEVISSMMGCRISTLPWRTKPIIWPATCWSRTKLRGGSSTPEWGLPWRRKLTA